MRSIIDRLSGFSLTASQHPKLALVRMITSANCGFEAKIESYRGNIKRAAVELAKDWRTDKILRRLEALLIIADKEHTFIISGTGDVIEPEDGVAAIGSGGPYAQAAAKGLFENTNLPAREIVEKSMKIASNICIYTNENITIEELNG